MQIAKIQIVIEIPEDIYKSKDDEDYIRMCASEICEAFENGTPLPKGHGRLVDADKLPMDLDWCDIEKALTVLEADNPCKNCRKDGECCMTCEYE